MELTRRFVCPQVGAERPRRVDEGHAAPAAVELAGTGGRSPDTQDQGSQYRCRSQACSRCMLSETAGLPIPAGMSLARPVWYQSILALAMWRRLSWCYTRRERRVSGEQRATGAGPGPADTRLSREEHT
jgi:hypothetical protein